MERMGGGGGRGKGGEYLHSQAVIRHGHAGVAVPAHVHGGVGAVVRLFVQGGAGGVHVVLRLLL